MNAPNSFPSIFDSQGSVTPSAQKFALIEELLSIGTALSGSRNLEELLELILTKSRDLTCSDAGSVYLIDKADKIPKLLFTVSQNDSLPQASFREFAIPLSHNSLAGYVALTGKSLNIADAYELADNLPYKLHRNVDRDFSYRTRSVLVLPMQDQDQEYIGVLQLINRKINCEVKITNENALEVTQPYSEWEEQLLRCLASQASISIERNLLQENIEKLFSGFATEAIKLIETLDPPTSGRSERVAALTVSLAQAIASATNPPWHNFSLSERQIRELHYCALLYDLSRAVSLKQNPNSSPQFSPQELENLNLRLTLTQCTLELDCSQRKWQYLLAQGTANYLPSDSPQIQELDRQLAKNIVLIDDFRQILNQLPQVQNREAQLTKLQKLAAYKYRDCEGNLQPVLTAKEQEKLVAILAKDINSDNLVLPAQVKYAHEFLKSTSWAKHLHHIPAIPQGKTDTEVAASLPTQILALVSVYEAITNANQPVSKALKALQKAAQQQHINADLVELFCQNQVYRAIVHDLSPIVNSQ